MTGLDTNVPVRYRTRDDPRRSRQAAAIVAEAVSGGGRVFVSAVVLCELVWVLGAAVGYQSARTGYLPDRVVGGEEDESADESLRHELSVE